MNTIFIVVFRVCVRCRFDIDSDPSILPHVAVWCMGRWYSMSVVRGDQRGAGEGGSSSALAVFTAYLRSLIALQQDAQRRNERESEDSEPAVAVLTSGERSFWSRARDEIATSNGVAAATLRQVESAAFHVVLSPECPRTPRERMNLCCHGGGGCGIDLWMDKSLTYLVFANGEVGFNMEHTHADAPIHARIVEHMRVAIVQDLSRAPAAQVSSSSDSDSVGGGDAWSSALRGADALALPAARHLSWNLRPGTASRASVDALITEGTAAARANIGAHRLDLVHAPHVSSGRIKASKMSPDSFVQVALQLAFHRDQVRAHMGCCSCSWYSRIVLAPHMSYILCGRQCTTCLVAPKWLVFPVLLLLRLLLRSSFFFFFFFFYVFYFFFFFFLHPSMTCTVTFVSRAGRALPTKLAQRARFCTAALRRFAAAPRTALRWRKRLHRVGHRRQSW